MKNESYLPLLYLSLVMAHYTLLPMIGHEMGAYVHNDEAKDLLPFFSHYNEFGDATIYGWYYTMEINDYCIL
jgi:hypothetical protein